MIWQLLGLQCPPGGTTSCFGICLVLSQPPSPLLPGVAPCCSILQVGFHIILVEERLQQNVA